MTTPIIVGSIATMKVIQTAVAFFVVGKIRKTKKYTKKEVVKSWTITQFLEESKFVK